MMERRSRCLFVLGYEQNVGRHVKNIKVGLHLTLSIPRGLYCPFGQRINFFRMEQLLFLLHYLSLTFVLTTLVCNTINCKKLQLDREQAANYKTTGRLCYT